MMQTSIENLDLALFYDFVFKVMKVKMFLIYFIINLVKLQIRGKF